VRAAATAAGGAVAAAAADAAVGGGLPRARRAPARRSGRRPWPRRWRQRWRTRRRRRLSGPPWWRRAGSICLTPRTSAAVGYAAAAAVGAMQPPLPAASRPLGWSGAGGGAPPRRVGGARAAAPRRWRLHRRHRGFHRRTHDVDSRRHGRVTAPPLRRRRSRATAAVASGRQAPAPPPAVGRQRAARGGSSAGVGRAARRRGSWPGLGHARPCPPPPVVVAPAGGRPPSTLCTCTCRGKSLLVAPMAAGAASSASSRSAWQRWGHASAAPPADREGAPSGAQPERPPAPRRRACARGRGSSGAPPPPCTRGCCDLVSERRCLLVRTHPQKMLVMCWSIFRLVKMVLSFRKSRVFSRTRFQLNHSAQPLRTAGPGACTDPPTREGICPAPVFPNWCIKRLFAHPQ